jgi:hypothetical protein
MTQFMNRSRLARAAAVGALALAAAAIAAPPAMAKTGPGLRAAAHQPAATGTSTSHLDKATARRQAAAGATTQALVDSTCGTSLVTAPGSSPAGGYLPLSLFGIPPISGVGDDTMTNFSVPSYTYAGRTYTGLAVGSNGYVQAGSATAVSLNNQNFPNPTDPNGVIAAFWTDLNPAAAGAVRIGTLTDGADTWIVADWEGVREFSTASNTHSFQIWIGVQGDANPGEDVSIAYGANTGNGDGGFLTVGAENENGVLGNASYFNGVGTLPTNGTQLRVTFTSNLIASFDATPDSGAAPLHVVFDASTSTDDVGITSYDWDFGDSSTGTGVTTSHDYAGGVYTATLTVSDGDGFTCSTSQEISVQGGFSVNNVSASEGAGTATFTVSRPNGPAASVDVSASPGSAGTPSDFTAAPATLSFAAGETSKSYVVSIVGDTTDESTENYSVALTNAVNEFITDGSGAGTIVDDDPPVQISVNDANTTEGNSGTKNLTFQVRLNQASGRTVKVTFRTANGSAVAPSDYTSKTVVVTFMPGQTVKNVPVKIKGDRVREPNETFFVLLNNPVNATIADPNGSGGIINND